MKLPLPLLALLLCIPAHLLAQTLPNYQATVNSQTPSYYFTLDGTLVDSVGGSLALTAAGGAYGGDYFGNAGLARSYTAATDSLSTSTDIAAGGGPVGGNSSATGVGSVSLLFQTMTSTAVTGQRFLFAEGNTTGNANAFSLFIENTSNTDPNALKLRIGDKTTTIFPAVNLSASTWYYFAVTYDESRNSLGGGEIRYFIGQAGGTLTAGTIDIGNVSVVGDSGLPFVLGNSAVGASGAFRNPGNGQIDEFALWNRELSSTEVGTQYANLAVPEPSSWALLGLCAVMFSRRRR